MHFLERCCITLRHNPSLDRMDWLWDWIRPYYNSLVAIFGLNGLERTINRTDRLLVLPQVRGVQETYEPEVWHHLMAHVEPGDTIVDVGAFIGLYTIALAKRVGPSGKVVAFEPDPANFSILKAHITLNGMSNRTELIQAAAGIEDGTVLFELGRMSESHISCVHTNATQTIRCISLDTLFAGRRLDLMKIDVEGYEEEVLKGATNLLQDRERRPRVIYIEVHPYAWPAVGTSTESLCGFLAGCNYRVLRLDGQPVKHLDSWGEIVAFKCDGE